MLVNNDWNKMYLYARDYYWKYHNLDMPIDYSILVEDEEVNLERWLWDQKVLFVKKRLSYERINKLNAIGITWEKFNDVRWEDMFRHASDYNKKYGNLYMPTYYNFVYNDEVINLGNWLSKQKHNYKAGILSNDRIQRLESINIKWNESMKQRWDIMFECASNFYKKNNNLIIQRKYFEFDSNNNIIYLGNWIALQRHNYKTGKLSESKIEKLESIGMIWDYKTVKIINNDENWNNIFNYVKEYYDEHGTASIPVKYYVNYNGRKICLARWLGAQRRCYKEGTLSSERISKLQSIDFAFDVKKIRKQKKEDQWYEVFNYAKEYYNKHKNLNMPTNYSFESNGQTISLDSWIKRQIKYYRIDELPPEKIQLLESIGIKFEKLDDKWGKMYRLLLMYYAEHGNISIPYNYSYYDEDNNLIKLGEWVNLQKKLKRAKPTKQNLFKIDLLVALGMNWEFVDEKKKPLDEGHKTLTKSLNNK